MTGRRTRRFGRAPVGNWTQLWESGAFARAGPPDRDGFAYQVPVDDGNPLVLINDWAYDNWSCGSGSRRPTGRRAAAAVPAFAASVARVAADPTLAPGATVGPSLGLAPGGPSWLVNGCDGQAAAARLWQMLGKMAAH